MKKELFHFLTGWAIFAVGLVAFSATALGQPLPSPADFVRNLDVRCYQIPNQPALNVPLQLTHLNPVFQQMGLPPENVVLGPPRNLCVPVRKNNQVPPANTLPFIQFVDWKCYQIQGPQLNVPLQLNQLNPVIAGMFGPVLQVIVREPQQLCVPVAKNGQFPPPAVRRLVEQLDVKCYRIETNAPAFGGIQLTHLNPLFGGIPPQATQFVGPNPIQLCVPVAKNNQFPPTDVFNHVRFSDVLCYRLQGPPLNQVLNLQHLNPLLIQMGLPPENVPVTVTEKLCVPVAKNGQFPPT